MELKDYQRLSQRTLNLGGVHSEQITNMALGIAGEAGEVVDLIKKHVFHGHDLNDDKAIEELGDLMFYIAGLATLLGYDLDEIGAYNVDKLKRRYEKGFSQEASKARVDTKKDNLITDTRYKGMDKPLVLDCEDELNATRGLHDTVAEPMYKREVLGVWVTPTHLKKDEE